MSESEPESIVESDQSDYESDDSDEPPTLQSIGSSIAFHTHGPHGNDLGLPKEVVVRQLHPTNYITSDWMTLAELTEVVSHRIQQIESTGDAQIFVDYGKATSAKEIAMMEIQQKRSPLSVVRPLNPGVVEVRPVNSLLIPGV
jgi:hypothetical protein